MRLPNGMGSVSKMSGKRRKPWRVRVTIGWTPDGKQMYKNIGTYSTRREAMEALTSWNQQPLNSTDKMKRETAIAELTFEDIYRKMYAYREPKASEATLKNYQVAFKNLEPLHQQPFCRIKKPHLQDVFDDCEKSSSTKNKMKNLVNMLYKYAIENELATTDYSKMIDMEKTENEREYTPFSEEEIETIWKHADAGDEVAKIVILQIYTGTRITELLELKKENIHLEESYCVGGKKTISGKERIIPLHRRIVPVLAEFYDQDRPFLFINSRGTRLQYRGFLNHFTESMEKWGMDHTTHDCRRAAATRLSVADVPYHIIEQILGHKAQHVTGKHYIFKDVKQMVKYINYVK